jgi:CHAD domain-containing protein
MNVPLARFAAAQTFARGRRLRSEMRRAMRIPEDAEAIHDLRVAIRRFTQCLRTFEQFLNRKHARKMRRRLRRLMDSCGAARNVDIACGVLEAAGFCGPPFVSVLRKERVRRQDEMVQRLERWRRQKRSAGVTRGLRFKGPRKGLWDGAASAAENAYRALPPLAADLFASGEKAADAGSTHQDLHKFRVEAKRFRYTLELFRPIYGADLDSKISLLRELQEKLGGINDCVTSLTLVTENPRAAKAVRKLLAAREADFRRFWRSPAAARSRVRWVTWLKGPRNVEKGDHGSLHPKARRG